MPEKVNLDAPMLFDGISRQPVHLRRPNQVESAGNVIFSVVDGARKRPGSVLVGVPSLGSDSYRLHAINRDADEQYLVIYGAGSPNTTLAVLDAIAGTAAAVNVSTEAQAYLNSGTPDADELRLTTIADVTFITNTNVAIALEAAPSYTVDYVHDTYEDMTATNPEPFSYHQTLNDSPAATAGYWQYEIDESGGSSEDTATFASWQRDDANTDGWKGPRGKWNNGDKNPMGFKARFQRQDLTDSGFSYNNTTGALSKVGAFANYSRRAPDEIQIVNATNIPNGFYAVISRDSDDQVTIASALGANDTVDVVGISQVYDTGELDFTGENAKNTMQEIAAAIQAALQDATNGTDAANTLVAWSEDDENFIVTAPYRGAGTAVLDFTAPDSGLDLSDLSRPFQFSDGTATPGTGSPSSDTIDIDERWVSIAAPGGANAIIDAGTMPVTMTRTSLSPLTFEVDIAPWKPRLSGTNETNPAPQLLAEGAAVADVSYYDNRLVLAGDEYVAFSESGDIYNFYLPSATNLTDSDPISRALSSDQVTLINWIAYLDGQLTFWTKADRQFRLDNIDPITPTNAPIVPTTSYTMIQTVRPAPMRDMLYFGQQCGDHVDVWEYMHVDDGDDAKRISAHVEGLIGPDLRTITATSNSGTVLALPVAGSSIYVYRTHWESGQRVQSAWSSWEMDDGYAIHDAATIDDDIYILVNDGTQWTVERISSQCPFDMAMAAITTTTTTTAAPTTTTTTTTPCPDGLYCCDTGDYCDQAAHGTNGTGQTCMVSGVYGGKGDCTTFCSLTDDMGGDVIAMLVDCCRPRTTEEGGVAGCGFVPFYKCCYEYSEDDATTCCRQSGD